MANSKDSKSKKTEKESTLNAKDLKQVQDHYLDYPYPQRNPEDDKHRLLKMYGDYLGEINHWLFRGKEDFKKGFRTLIAGGGTGDSAIFLAEQLKNFDAEVVYLDFSKNSMKIAQERAKNRGLTNIKWVHDSILNLPKLGLGKFDYINCTGVLHHLSSPDEGLKALQQSLTDRGGMGIMVYAQIGRTGVYQIQELLRYVNQGVESRQEEVKNGWSIINNLPATNWYVRGQDLLRDHVLFGDIGMYDMFLHKQDRAYTVPQIYEFVEKAGLNFVDFNSSHSRLVLRLENYIKDPELLARLKKLDIRTQQGICELITGNIIKHSFYVSNQKDTIASFDDLDNIPYIYTIANLAKQIYDYIDSNSQIIGGNVNFSWKSDLAGDLNINLPVSEYTKYLFKHMIDETKSFKEIFDLVRSESGKQVSDADLTAEIKRLLPIMHEAGALLMRNKSVEAFPSLISGFN